MKKKVQAIMYENVDKKKLLIFLKVLEGFEKSSRVLAAFQKHQQELQESSSLLNLTTIGAGFPDISNELEYFAQAFDRNEALRCGHIVPASGVNEGYDQSVQDIQVCEAKLDAYLKKQKDKFNDQTIKYAHKMNEAYQLEISQKTVTRVSKLLSAEYEQKSSTKDVRRYWTKEISSLVDQLEDAKERRDEALRDTSRQMFAQFSEHYTKWKQVIDVLSELDCLQSLSVTSQNQAVQGASTRPELIDANDNNGQAVLELRDCSHPVLAANRQSASFVPNDTVIGTAENSSRFVLVSGPNMGGKSTLLRQTCVAVIMAQIGCYVPASACRLTPVDRIFTRVGANDKIMEGQSTFLVELTETSHILKNATSRSLV
jgi:DNA mismatch repair protein MSH6